MINSDRAKFFSDSKIIGIDPGINGGIAIFSVTSNKVIEVVKMPDTAKDLYDFLKIYSKNSKCFLEKVQGMPGQSGSGMFTFGKGFGYLEMALIALNIPVEEVTPQRWQKIYQLGVKGDQTSSVWKNKLKSKAQQLFPHIKLTLSTSDAILIMNYGLRETKTT